MTDRAKTGHNGGPPLDEPADRQCGMCKHCAHWKAPPESEQRAYEHFRLGLSRRRLKRPIGSCDRVLIGNRQQSSQRLPLSSAAAISSPRRRSRRPVAAAS